MCLQIRHNPLSLASRRFSIHQESRKPPSFAADSNVAFDVVVVGNPAIGSRLLKSSMLDVSFSAQKIVNDFFSFTIVVIKLTVVSLVIRWLLASRSKVCTLFPWRSCMPIIECTSVFVVLGIRVCDLVLIAVRSLISYFIGNASMWVF